MGIYVEGFLVALRGAPMTIGVSIAALIIGMALGLLFAMMRTSKNKVLEIIARIYIEIVRGTPMVVQALIMAFGLPVLLQSHGSDFRWSNLVLPALIVCGLNSAAYMAEIIRGGIQAVDRGQVEAAQSLGMTKSQTTRLIVLPQAFKIVIPSMGNEMITLIKETAVLSYVGVVEVLKSAALWNSSTMETFAAYIGAALVYLMMTYSLSKLFGYFEKRMSRED